MTFFFFLVLYILFDLSEGKRECIADGNDYLYTETVESPARTIIVSGCPNHPYKILNEYWPVKENTTIIIPSSPKYDISVKSSFNNKSGPVGVLFSGAFVYSPYPESVKPSLTSVINHSTSASALEYETFDLCGCHSSSRSNATYHCHGPPVCLLQQLQASISNTTHSPQIGWASDGFPIYGPMGKNGVIMKSCSIQNLNIGVDICSDECGGYYGLLPDVDIYKYRYYIQGEYTLDKQCINPFNLINNKNDAQSYYPQTPICLKGCCDISTNCTNNNINICSTSAINGDTLVSPSEAAVAVNVPFNVTCIACWDKGDDGSYPPICGGKGSRSFSQAGKHPINNNTIREGYMYYYFIILLFGFLWGNIL
eukprot:GHVR01171250.1.p1 GENE.GHVR01171250.1~~GHVR01171250.1.p1  ORF type:complete len:375 (+),score=90.77 GHVR01171250.1:23-1126(+)